MGRGKVDVRGGGSDIKQLPVLLNGLCPPTTAVTQRKRGCEASAHKYGGGGWWVTESSKQGVHDAKTQSCCASRRGFYWFDGGEGRKGEKGRGGINKRLFYSLPLAFLSTLLGPVKLQFSTLVLTKFVAHRAENKHSCIEKRENETHSSGQTQQSEVIHGITQYGNRKKHRTSASIFLSVRCVDASCHQVRRK
jgi:hypothetical protein